MQYTVQMRQYVSSRLLKIRELPLPIWQQIFFLLKKAGLLLTVRGAKGGFLLAQSPKDITVGMVLRAIEHDLAPVKCVHDLESCTSKVRSSCVNRQIWVRLTNAIEDTVDNMTLEDLKVKYLKRKGNVT